MKELEPQKQFHIKQVAATMAIEDMPIDKQTRKNLTQVPVYLYFSVFVGCIP